MIKKHFLSVCFTVALTVASTMHTQAQTVIGMGTEQPNPNAVLDLVPENGNQGFLAPRLTSAQRQAASFTSKLSRADNGLLVFDINQGQFYYWFNGEWRVGTSGESPGGGPVVSGTTWYTGSTAPGGVDAAEGDFYIDESTGEVFRFSGGTFVAMGSLKGSATTSPKLSSVLEQGGSAENQKITNLGEPTEDKDAATKEYVDSRDLRDILNVDNNADNKQITNLASPTDDGHATNRKYVDDQDNAVKQYVDTKVTALPPTTNTDEQPLSDVLTRGNNANNKKITGLKDPDNPQDAATQNYVDKEAKIIGLSFDSDNNYIEITEGENTFGTSLNTPAAPTTLANGKFFIGNSADKPAEVTLTGDISVDNEGRVTITNITTAKIVTGAVTKEKINADVAGSGLVKNSSTAPLEVKVGNGLAIDPNNGSLRIYNPEAGYLGIGQGTGNNDYIQFVPVDGDAALAKDGTLTVTGLLGYEINNTGLSEGYVLQWKNNKWEPVEIEEVGNDVPVITTGSGEPDDGAGELGDIYIDTEENKAYVKIVGEWRKL